MTQKIVSRIIKKIGSTASKTIVIIFLCCILLCVAFFVNKDLFLKKEVPFDEVKELEMAYQWAYQAEITSQPTIEQANLN